ncbi:unnamed protein product, partial [Gulo gulo]
MTNTGMDNQSTHKCSQTGPLAVTSSLIRKVPQSPCKKCVPLRICHYPMPFTSFLPIPAHCALRSLASWLYLDSSCAPTSSPSPCDFQVLSSCPTFPHGSFSQ